MEGDDLIHPALAKQAHGQRDATAPVLSSAFRSSQLIKRHSNQVFPATSVSFERFLA